MVREDVAPGGGSEYLQSLQGYTERLMADAGTGFRLFGEILMHPQEMLLGSVLVTWDSACVTGHARRLWHSLTSCCGGCCMMCYKEMLLILWGFLSVVWMNMGEGEAEVK